MSKRIHDEITKVFASIESNTKELEALATKETSDETKASFAKLTGENEGLFARLTELEKANDQAKAAAAFALKNGKANVGYDLPGTKEKANELQRETGNITDRAFAGKVIAQAVCGVRSEAFAALTTGTANSIFLPSVVMDGIVPSRPSVITRALKRYGLTVEVEPVVRERKYPVPGIRAGGYIDPASPSAGTTSADELTESFKVTPKPLGTPPEPVQNTVLAAGDFVLDTWLKAATRNWELGSEKEDIASIVAKTTTEVTVADAAAVTYAKVCDWIESLPVRFDFNKVLIVSPTIYSLLLDLTSSDGNRAVTVTGGEMFVKGIPVEKTEYLGDFSGTTKKTLAILVCVDGLKPVDFGTPRMNYYNSTSKQDHTELQLARDHGFDCVASAVVKLVRPAA